MENASKALIMAAGVLIGILVLSLAVFLFMDFGAKASEIYSQVEHNQLTQYNAQYTAYAEKTDINIYDIITLCNLAKQNNINYADYTFFETEYKVTIKLTGGSTNFSNNNAQDLEITKQEELINTYNQVNDNGEPKYKFKCTNISYHDSGRLSSITIKLV